MKEIVPTMDSNLAFSLIKMMECFFEPFKPRDVSYFDAFYSRDVD